MGYADTGVRAWSRAGTLAQRSPGVAAAWHPRRNGEWTPDDADAMSNRKAWWLCPECGHEWEATVSNRTRGRGCPSCAGRVIIVGADDLSSVNSVLADEWHPTRNGAVTPEQIGPNAHRKSWWLCRTCGREWQARVARRTAGAGCPSCTSLQATHPDIARQWHPTLNATLTAAAVTSGSGRNLWWQCSACGHEWRARVWSRTNGAGCPACSGRVATPGVNDLATVNPELAGQWHPDQNGTLTPNQVTARSKVSVWWKCPACTHAWVAPVARRTKGHGCPACAGRVAAPGVNDLATVNPGLARQWHPTLNGDLTPQQVTAGTRTKAWWSCPTCAHDWEATVKSRSQGRGCPACAGQVGR